MATGIVQKNQRIFLLTQQQARESNCVAESPIYPPHRQSVLILPARG